MITLIQVATRFEATPIIQYLRLERIRLRGQRDSYASHAPGFLLSITGIGSSKIRHALDTLQHVADLAPSPHRWLNIGIAACACTQVPIGSLYQIKYLRTSIQSGGHSSDAPPFELPQPDQTHLPPATLMTVNTANSNGADLPPTCPYGFPLLIDMEGYAWVKYLHKHGATPPCQLACVKFVSDHARSERIDFRSLAAKYDAAVTDWLSTGGIESLFSPQTTGIAIDNP